MGYTWMKHSISFKTFIHNRAMVETVITLEFNF